jgi:hypothetical protein
MRKPLAAFSDFSKNVKLPILTEPEILAMGTSTVRPS